MWMAIHTRRLADVAYARSGDKGSSANIGVIAYSPAAFAFLQQSLTADVVKNFFRSMGVGSVARYELPNLNALNFVLTDVLAGGGSRSLRIDAQGKTLGAAILEMPLNVPAELIVA
jgi:hypothetical protein